MSDTHRDFSCSATLEEAVLLRSIGFICPIANFWRPDDRPFYVSPPSCNSTGRWLVQDNGPWFNAPRRDTFCAEVDTFEGVVAMNAMHLLRGTIEP